MPVIASPNFRTSFAILLRPPRSLANRELALELASPGFNFDRIIETLLKHSLSNPAKCAFAVIFKIAARSTLPLEMRMGRKFDLDLLARKAKEISEAHPEVFNPDLDTLPYNYINSETFIDWVTRSLDLHDAVTLKNGESYVVCDMLDANREPFYKVEGATNRGGFLIVPDRSEPEIHFEGLTYPGEKTVARLRYHDPESKLSVYEVIGDEYDLELKQKAPEVLCRNIRSFGIVKLFEDRAGHTLNSPAGEFGTTTLTRNYAWAEIFEAPNDVYGFPQKAHRPGMKEYNYNPLNCFVFAVFPGKEMRLTPMLRSGGIAEEFEYKEYFTDDPIRYTDALLVTGREEYEHLARQKATSRKQSLLLLGRSEADQQIFENAVYEESYYVTQRTSVPVERTAGYALNELYTRLLLLRGTHPLDRGLLFHLFQPAARRVSLVANFNNWAEMPMQRDESGLWWCIAPQLEPNALAVFKFKIDSEWGRGVNPINSPDPHANARHWVTGTETLFSRELARARLSEILGGK